MSRKIDTSDLSSLSAEDLKYLQDRERLPKGFRAKATTATASPQPDEGGESDEDLKPYSEMYKDELKAECAERDLPVSGNVQELIERLEADDEAADEDEDEDED